MTFSSAAALCSDLHATISLPRHQHDQFHLRLNRNQGFLVVLQAQKRKRHSPLIIRSALNNLKSNVGNSDNESTKPARVLLERLFAQTQKLEEKMNKDSVLSEDIELSINLEVLESDLQAALLALREKEEDLQDAERKVVLDHAELNHAKQDLERREETIAAACAKQKQMEEVLKKANNDLAFKGRQIEDLKLLVEEQNRKIAHSQSTLSVKEDELHNLRNELMKKNEEAASMMSELVSRDRLLNEANEVIKKQEARVEELQREVREKEYDLANSLQLREAEEESLKIAESKLEKQTVEWLSARKVLKELAEQASKNTNDVKETTEDFKRVSALLSDVRSELISSQESLASSRRILEDQACQLNKQEAELNEQKLSVTSYAKSLKDAQLEVENERTKWGIARAQRKELELQLSSERAFVERLEENLKREKSHLEQATQEIGSLQKQLQQKKLEFSDTQNLLQVKESELVEARLEIQHLKSEQTSVQLISEGKDGILWDAQQKLADVNDEVAQLQSLMKSKEDQLVQATGRLQEKEEHVLAMQNELDDTKLEFSEAASIIGRIAQLTNELISIKDEKSEGIRLAPEMDHDISFGKQKQLETELETTKESLRAKEMELLAAQRALTVKDEELRRVVQRLDAIEKEMEKIKEELWEDANALKTMGDSAIEKLQLESAQLEAEAATSMSSQLLKQTNMCTDFDIHPVISPTEGAEIGSVSKTSLGVRNNEHRGSAETENVPRAGLDIGNESLGEAEREVAHLLALTQKLVEEAGVTGTDHR